jgi:hypothetical protein
MKYFTV